VNGGRGRRASTSSDPFARFGAFIFRRRRWVLASWLVALAVCAPLAGKANGVLGRRHQSRDRARRPPPNASLSQQEGLR
jgi:hypothetical protein